LHAASALATAIGVTIRTRLATIIADLPTPG
jgi:hypothetical protein